MVLSCWKKACSCYCCCCCVFLIPLVVFAAVVASAYEAPPDVNVKEVRITDIKLTSDKVVLTIQPDIHVVNKNRSPLEGSIDTITVDLYSLDRGQQALSGVNSEPIYMAQAVLPAPVVVEAESETTFKMDVHLEAKAPDEALLVQRLNSDCAPLITDQKTKIRLVITDLEASALGVRLPKMDTLPTIELVVDCK